MKLFLPIYERTLALAGHPHAERWLAGVSAAESIFFPIPPDVMLAPMSLAKPHSAWRYALVCTIASVLGGVVGYALGLFAFELIEPVLHKLGYWDRFVEIRGLFAEYGFWVVFIAGFTPIPYKVFTIASGVASIGWIPFLLGSFIGRGGRFFLVAALIRWGGPAMEQRLRRHVELIGWIVLGLLLVIGLWLKFG